MSRWLEVYLAVALAVALPAAAQDPMEPDPDDPATTAMLHGSLQLSIEDAIAMGLKNNLDVEVTRHDPLIAWEDFRAAWGAYDPELFSDLVWESREIPIASSLQATTSLIERELDGNSGLRGKVPWLNATYALTYNGDRLTTDSSIQDLSPQYTATVAATVTVPLMRDLIWDQDWTRLRQAKVVYGASEEDFRRQVMDTVRAIETAYWDLVASEEQQRVAKKSVEAAEALLRQTRTQYEVGVVSRVEVTEAEAGLAEREVLLIRTTNAYRTAQDVLMNEVLGRGLRGGSRLEIIPSDRPDDYLLYDIDVEEAVRKAFDNRPELAAQQFDIERRQIEVKFRNNQRLPTLDVEGSYGYQGLAGGTNDAPPIFGPGPRPDVTNVGRQFEDTDDDFFNERGFDFHSIGARFSIPLFNQAARHQATKARIELRRANSALARLRQRIILDVRRAARDLESAQEGIGAAERAREAAEEQLRAERIRLEQGESTPFDVLLREEDLVEAESAKIDAIRVYRNSIVGLDREQGTILKARNILIDDVRGVR